MSVEVKAQDELALASVKSIYDAAEEANRLVDEADQSIYGTITYEYDNNGTIETVYKREDGTYFYYDANDDEINVSESDLVIDQGTGEPVTNRQNDGLTATIESASAQASSAQQYAEDAQAQAVNAQSSATDAYNYAYNAFNQLSDIEKVVDVLSWVSKHGQYEPTTDEEVVSGKYYFVRSGSGTTADPYVYTPVNNPTGNPSTQNWFVLSGVDEAVTNYVSTHLALTNDGLFVQIDNSSSRLQITSSGIYLWNASGVIAQYTSEVVLGDSTKAHIVLSPSTGLNFYDGSTRVAWVTSNTLHMQSAEIEKTLRIGQFKWKVQSASRMSLVYDPI